VKPRLVTAAALTAGLLLSVSGAEAATPTMDGKVVKVLKISAQPGLQENTANAEDREYCTIHCGRLPFVYKPAKGVKGGLMFTVTWTNPVSDADLSVVEAGPNKTWKTIGGCAGIGNTLEKVYVPPAALRPGKTYAMIIYYFHSINETFNGKVEINVPSTIPTTVPKKADDNGASPMNCTL
jgi:hypothetical protein